MDVLFLENLFFIQRLDTLQYLLPEQLLLVKLDLMQLIFPHI